MDDLRFTYVDGDTVTAVPDSGPNSNDLTGSNVVYEADLLGGMGTVDMRSTNAQLVAADHASLDLGTDPFEIYMVWVPDLPSNGTFTFIGKNDGTGTDNWRFFRDQSSGRGGTLLQMKMTRGSALLAKKATVSAVTNDTGYIHSVQCNISDDTIDFFEDGTEHGSPSGTATSDVDNGNDLVIGNNVDGGSQNMDGFLGEMILITHNSSSTVTNRIKIEGYLAHKWGLTSSLPSGHTYETEPPRLTSGFTG
jgi:hypothetical protein